MRCQYSRASPRMDALTTAERQTEEAERRVSPVPHVQGGIGTAWAAGSTNCAET